MKRLLPLLIALTLTTTAASAQSPTTVGLGFSLHSSGVTTSLFDELDFVFSPVNLYLPITFSGFRIEPEVGIFRVSESDDTYSLAQTGLQLGTGVFATQERGEALLYYGGRFGLLRNSSKYEYDIEGADDTETSQTNLYLAPALGAEYFFADHFSLGGEGQLMYLRAGSQEVDGEESDDESEGSMLRTRALFFVRWHF